jgi:hypothetical protein
MTLPADLHAHEPVRAARVLLGAPGRVVGRLRRDPPPEQVSLVLLCLLSAALFALSLPVGSQWAPPGLQVVPLLLGGLLLTRRAYRQLIAVTGAFLLAQFLTTADGTAPPGAVFVVGVAGLIGHEFARSREETGLGGLRGDSVLVELRRRLELQGDLPVLAPPWHAESVVKPAGGGPFAGDFVVSSLTGDHRLEVALVDVSGKGVDAGSRALLLSGALGGLLGAKQPQEYLEAANSYLVRQDWEEGFATAVHLTLDMGTGAYEVASAGHPPVAHFDAGSGRWGLLEVHGPALGLLHDVRYEAATGTLRHGDALLLYTDGLVEVPGRDLSVGIDKLLGEAERLVTRGFEGGGEILVNRVSAGSSDDRGLVLLWRSGQ